MSESLDYAPIGDTGSNELSRRSFVVAGSIVFATGVTALLSACGEANPVEQPTTPDPETSDQDESPSPIPAETAPTHEDRGLGDPVAQDRAAMIISTFENSTTKVQYGYAENIGDGRGITAGRAGFCSGTGDMLMVVKDYVEAKPGNPLAGYLPRLHEIDEEFAQTNWEEPIGSTEGLEGLETAWQDAAKDEVFRESQDKVFNELYLNPAIEQARAVETADGRGVTTAVGQLIILDTLIQHGGGTGQDSLQTIMQQTASAVGPRTDERRYLKTFLAVRKKHLEHATNPDTRQGWAESVGRVDALRQILDQAYASGATDLRGRLVFDVYEGDHYDLPPAA